MTSRMISEDICTCEQCGVAEHIDLLDAKPSDPASDGNNENKDFDRLECIACYGPGWDSNTANLEETLALSIAPQLKPHYERYWKTPNAGESA